MAGNINIWQKNLDCTFNMILDFSSLSVDTSNALNRRLRKFLHERANQIEKDVNSYWPDGADDANRLKLIQDREAILRLLKEME